MESYQGGLCRFRAMSITPVHLVMIRFHHKQAYLLFCVTVCKTVCPMLSDRCLSVRSVLSVTFVYCGQTVGWIKMTLGMQVGRGPGHIVSDRDPGPPPLKGHSHSPIFGPYLLWPNGSMDQDVTSC